MTYPQLAGFLFSMANAPELIPPSEWIPMAFNDQDAGYETQGEAEQVLQAMMALYNDSCLERRAGSTTLPPGCEIRAQPLDNLADDAALSQWARGFLTGHTYLDDSWNDYTPEELDEELGSMLMVLTFFATPALAEAYHKEGKGKTSLEQLATWVGDLAHQETWARLAVTGEPFARGEFDPAKIHAELERRLWPASER